MKCFHWIPRGPNAWTKIEKKQAHGPQKWSTDNFWVGRESPWRVISAKKITRTAQQNLSPSGQMVQICWAEAFAGPSKQKSNHPAAFCTRSLQNLHPAQQILAQIHFLNKLNKRASLILWQKPSLLSLLVPAFASHPPLDVIIVRIALNTVQCTNFKICTICY